MARGMLRTLIFVRRWWTAAILALVFFLCSFSVAWGKAKGRQVKAVALQSQRYSEGTLSARVMALEGRFEKSMVIARKRSKGRSSQDEQLVERRWRDYESLSPEEKARLNRKFKEWKSLPPEEQERLRGRMKRWEALPPEDRSLYERRFDQWQKLSPEERERIRERLQEGNGLPQEEKEEIRRRFRE